MESLDMLANNLANATTTGFKADREFYSTYLSVESLDGPTGTLPMQTPVIEKNWTDFSQGINAPTGSSLDVALDGHGFFVLRTDSGPLYTRSGNFRIQPDGTLVAQSGALVMSKEDKPIKLDSKLPVDINDAGVIRQGGRAIANLAIVDFEDRSQLSKTGSTYFRYDKPSHPPIEAKAKVEQGRLEGANFQPAESAVRLVSVMRQFEMLQRAITLGSEMNRRAIEEVARVRE
jgi:flagellar basal-body rod protein FlgF